MILLCQIETLRQTCWVTDDRLLFKVSGILTLKSQLRWNRLLTFHSKSVMSCEFVQTLGIYSTWFLCGNCPLGFLFPINISFVNISSWLNIQRDGQLTFFKMCEKKSIHGIRNQLILRRLWYIFYTILLNIFLLVWFISNWMLSLEYWKSGQISNMKTAL